VEPVKAPGIRHQTGTFCLEHLPDRMISQLRMVVRLGIRDALVQQPGVQFFIVLHPKPGREEAFPNHANLVLDLPLLPARGRIAGDWIDHIMTAHPQEASVVGTLAVNEDGLHGGLHVVVDAARAGAFEKGEGAIMRVEHHLLALARIGPHEQHPAVA